MARVINTPRLRDFQVRLSPELTEAEGTSGLGLRTAMLIFRDVARTRRTSFRVGGKKSYLNYLRFPHLQPTLQAQPNAKPRLLQCLPSCELPF